MFLLSNRFASAIIVIMFAVEVFAQNNVLTNPVVMQAVKMGVSQPMRDLPISSGTEKSSWKDGIIPLLSLPRFKRNNIDIDKDGSQIDYRGPYNISAITQNFDGVGANGSAPPDPSGDVGPNHYVQMVNVRTQIWNKSGVSLVGPVNNSTFWSTLGPPFSTTNSGDPIVLYDDMADRWMVSQFCLPNGLNPPCYILIAISKTPDPTGAYWQYAFTFPNMPDYPKFGVWPDGYYMSANVFSPASAYLGTYAAVFNRNAMLTGGAGSMIYFSLGPAVTSSPLPSDCDGIAPPLAAPNYFLETYNSSGGNTNLGIYQFHVDWGTPANSTFTGPLLLTTPAFNLLPTGTDIQQLGTTNKLDNLDDRPMNRLQYRNFGGHQAMVVCQTVSVANPTPGRAGIRWWELRKTLGNWIIYQEGTYAPADTAYRWMGSIAMDANGIIALGYSTSKSTIRPQIRYTGRYPCDPLGVMTFAETLIHAGGGSQTGGLSRWGDYTQMTVDPSADGTFWYTNEYIPTNGSFNWKTRIAALKFDITTLSITAIPEGFYNLGLNRLNMRDTVRAYLRNIVPPYAKVDSAKAVLDSITFTGDFKFVCAPSSTYYLSLNHRNTIETWASSTRTIVKGLTYPVDFTTAQSNAYGNNMIKKGTKWCLYSGDINQDGSVDLSDMVILDNDNLNFVTGYVPSDVNGDNASDLSDMVIIDNNNAAFVSKKAPPGALRVKTSDQKSSDDMR
jgi:hypothetical protein